jgi:RNA polymerase sigma-70 factor (ECF subfamily)
MDETHEQQLTDRLAADLDEGFTELVRVHVGVVHSFLHRVSGSASDAEDLGQETFLRAYAALEGYPPKRRRELRIKPWLMTIAANVWRNHLRGRARRPVLAAVHVEEACLPLADGPPGPEDRALLGEDRARLTAALTAVPELYRVPVVLRHIAGLSYQEVAEAQQRPVGTIKAQVSRGLKMLRAELDRDKEKAKEVTS